MSYRTTLQFPHFMAKVDVKLASKKVLRRESQDEINDSATAFVEPREYNTRRGIGNLPHRGRHYDDRPAPVYAFAVLVWCDGLDYDMDGKAYFDDYPDYHPASYHRTRKGAETAVAYMEHGHAMRTRGDGRQLSVIIADDYEIPEWDVDRLQD